MKKPSKWDDARADAVEIVKRAYCERPNYDDLVQALLQGGLAEAKRRCVVTPGIPLKPMLAQPTLGVADIMARLDLADEELADEAEALVCEWKYDGERAQIHRLESGKYDIFSRNQESHTEKYPDIIARLPGVAASSTKTFILDSEVVAWDKDEQRILPFQVLSTRKRKLDASETNVKVQVRLARSPFRSSGYFDIFTLKKTTRRM